MLNLDFPKNKGLKILCLGAHSDDIEIGCGGSLLKFQKIFQDLEFLWVVFSGDKTRTDEALKSANTFLQKIKVKKITIFNFKESYFPFKGEKIKDSFEKIKNNFSPDIIFTHYKDDAHQDHRLICELTWNTFRNNLILEYEIPKYDGDFGTPNFYVPINEKELEEKIEVIENNFKSQISKNWFSSSTFRGLSRLRGIESNSKSGYAEAFYCRKIIF
jgi:LmbE family N-acetylglucosaminyl deacetylase